MLLSMMINLMLKFFIYFSENAFRRQAAIFIVNNPQKTAVDLLLSFCQIFFFSFLNFSI